MDYDVLDTCHHLNMTEKVELRTLDKMLEAIDPEDAVFVLKRLVQGNLFPRTVS